MTTIQNRSFGNTAKDLSVENLSANCITSRILSSIESNDINIMFLEEDIIDMQEITSINAEDITANADDIADLETSIDDLSNIQSNPWFFKSNSTYELINSSEWRDEKNNTTNTLPTDPSVMFVRKITLNNKYKSALILLPITSNSVGNSRCVGIISDESKAFVYVTTNLMETTRLKSWDMEYIPSTDNPPDVLVGHQALLSKPFQLNNYVFGSDRMQTSSGNCIVFPGTGEWYVQSIYLDNSGQVSELVIIGQKYGTTTLTPMGSVEVYGFQ